MLKMTDREFDQLAGFIKSNYGIKLYKEKKPLAVGRLSNVVLRLNLKSFSQYYDYVISDKTGEAANELVNRITTNHTFFMREKEHFFYLRDEILPNLSKTLKDKDIRIWSAGCSTGEEPYTIAMIMDEYFQEEKIFWDTKILATDISEKVLGIARKGEYSNEKISALPANWRLHYFNKVNMGKSILIDKIRKDVIYRRFNLAEEVFPFKKKFHIIFCRNVMIYFDNETKNKLVERLYDITEPGGFLFIGYSEGLNREKTRYKYVMPAVYRKE
jgi:chemotaxis protein methyltransferase CheR